MAVTTMVTAILATTYLRLYRALSLQPAIELSLKVFAVGTLILWAGLKTGWQPSTAVLYVWTGAFGTLAPVQCWSLISDTLLTRQAKKDMGVIGSGAILGASVGGLFARWVVEASGPSTLLPVSTLLVLLAVFLVQALGALKWSASSPGIQTRKTRTSPRFVILVLIVVGISSIVTTFADFQFKVVAQRELYTAERLTAFFGSFYAIVGFVTFLFQLLITPFLMSRIGVSFGLAFLPLGLVFGNVYFLGTASLFAAILLKGNEQLFRHSVDRSSLEVLYMAIPDDIKVHLKSLIDTVGVRTAEGLGAVLLILLFSVLGQPLSTLATISLFLLGISLVCTILLGKEYPRALRGAIQQKELDLSTVKTTFFTTDFYGALPELWKVSNKSTLMDTLQLLDATGNRKLHAHLVPLLKHDDPEVRLAALRLLFRQEKDCSETVEPLMSDPDSSVRLEVIRYLCFRSSMDPLEKLAHLMTDPDPSVQAAACACSLNLDAEPEQQDAYRRLEKLMNDSLGSSHRSVRLEVARVLQHVRSSESSERIARRLLSDDSLDVKRAVLRSIAFVKPEGLKDDLLQLLDDPRVRNELRTALAAYGPSILPSLESIFSENNHSLEKKKSALKIIASIDSPRSIEILLTHAQGSSLPLRFVSVKTLNRMQKRHEIPLPREALNRMLDQEIVALEVEMERVRFFSPKPGGVMERVLAERQRWARERIFRVLGLIYDRKGIHNAYLALQRTDRRKSDAALEYLDTILAPEHRTSILELLESPPKSQETTPATRKAVLLGYIGARDELPAAALIADLSNLEIREWHQELLNALQVFPGLDLIQETLHWRYETVDRNNIIQRKLSSIQRIQKLGTIDIFSELGPPELLLLSNNCMEQELHDGDLIFSEGDAAEEIYFLIEGNVEIKQSSGFMKTLKPGESFGALSVLGNQPRLFTAMAINDCMCLKLKRESLRDIMDDYPVVSYNILRIMARKVADLIRHTTTPS